MEAKETSTGYNRVLVTLIFTVAIALIGALMMLLTSSPVAEGAAFLWLPAALQLIAGVWLGPVRGFIAGGVGAYAAGILAFQSWGLVGVITNLVAGGFANSLLPSLLFKVFGINLISKHTSGSHKKGAVWTLLILVVVLLIPLWLNIYKIGVLAYLPSLLIVLAAPKYIYSLKFHSGGFVVAFLICVFVSAISATIGIAGRVVAGDSLELAFFGTGVGWFLGDTISSVLGIFWLGLFTSWAIKKGIYRRPVSIETTESDSKE